MRNESAYNNGSGFGFSLANLNMSRRAAIGIILAVALLAFELFNFDTTRYALRNLLGDVSFVGLQWAGILAIAFCAIDFAGLARLFTPEKGSEEPKEVWYLMGAWLLGATMNAIMTWWAVSLTLLDHNLGNEVMGRESLLKIVPIFVAVLVWLTRILFIGAFTVAGEHIFDFSSNTREVQNGRPAPARPTHAPKREPVQRPYRANVPVAAQPTAVNPPVTDEMPGFLDEYEPAPSHPNASKIPASANGRPCPTVCAAFLLTASKRVPATATAR